MNTTTIRPHLGYARRPSTATGTVAEALRSTARDFVAGLLSITKGSLLSQQSTRPRLRRF
jgi:hypothetical protein